MRHSIAVKFIALCLAALSLLAVVGSAAGIIGLAATDLYDNSFDQYYNDSMHSTRQNFAVNLVHRYASLNLGNLPDQYLNDYYGINWMYNTFRYGYFYYTIRDEHGDVVESTMKNAPEGGTTYEMVVTNLRYRTLVSILAGKEGDLVLIEPPVTTELPDTTESIAATLPPAQSDEEAAEETAEETAETATDASEIPALASGAKAVDWMDVSYGDYYDHELGRMVEFTFVYEDLPPYTVELYLLPGAMPEEYAWTLLRQIWEVRHELFWVLGISVLFFAVFLVWLCVAAGRKKGTDEIKAGGLNRIPLDLYLAGGGAAVVFATVMGFEALDFILRNTPNILVPVAVMGGFVICLVIVAFLFACAAQFKTSGNYWWHNSITGRCLRLLVWLWNKLIDICVWGFSRLPDFLKKVFALMKRLVLWTLGICKAILLWIWNLLKRTGAWCTGKLAAFYGLLPLMWQWLLTGAVLILGLTFALLTRSEGMLVLALCIGFAVILYGASCFGTLLDGAKRMGKGNLETKVFSLQQKMDIQAES